MLEVREQKKVYDTFIFDLAAPVLSLLALTTTALRKAGRENARGDDRKAESWLQNFKTSTQARKKEPSKKVAYPATA